MPESFKYWAFVSYSHRDKAWGDWLHKALETYRVPKRLVGRASRDGTVPRRLFPVFRDREELPTSADLGSNISDALKASRYLVVICSPRAAVSKWVNEEVRTFKMLGRADRILCLIVDGEPNASDRPESAAAECFPEAVRYIYDLKGKITKERTEPIAADARERMDGKAAAKLKIIAGLLGVGYDELRQRERQRQIRLRIAAGAAAVAFVAAVVAGWELYQYSLLQESLAAAQDAARMVAADEPDAAIRRVMSVSPPRADSVMRPFPAETVAALALALERNRLDLILHGIARETDSIEFAPGGDTLVTASRDDAVRIWDARTGHLLRRLDHPKTRDGIWRAAFLSHGASIVTAGGDGVVRVFGNGDAQPREGRGVHDGPVRVLAANDASGQFATGDGKGIAVLWSVKDFAPQKLAGPGTAINDLAFSRDGARLIAAGEDGTVRVWDTASRRLLAELHDPDTEGLPFRRARLSPNGDRVVAVSEGRDALLWDLANAATPRLVARLAHERQVWFADFDPSGKLIATASADRTARLWEAATGRPVGVPMVHGNVVRHLAFNPAGTVLATSSQDHAVRLWNATNGMPVPNGLLRGHANFALLAVFDSTGTRLASASSDMSVRLWRAEPENPAAVLRGHDGPVRRARFDPAGRRIVTAGDDGRVILWDAATGAVLGGPPRFPVTAYGAEFDPRGERVVIALRDRTARVWDIRSNALAMLRGHSGPVVHASFDPSGTRIATVTFGADSRVRIFDAATGAFTGLQTQEEPSRRSLYSVVYHPDGRRVLVAAHAEQAFIWDTSHPANRIELKRDPVRGAAGHDNSVNWATFDAQGRFALTASDDRTARLWDAGTGAHLRVLEPHEDFVLAAAFAPDGVRAVTATRRGTVRFWRVADGALLAIRYVPGAVAIYSLDFSRDGRRVLAALDDGSVRSLDVETDAQSLLDRAGALIARWRTAP